MNQFSRTDWIAFLTLLLVAVQPEQLEAQSPITEPLPLAVYQGLSRLILQQEIRPTFSTLAVGLEPIWIVSRFPRRVPCKTAVSVRSIISLA